MMINYYRSIVIHILFEHKNISITIITNYITIIVIRFLFSKLITISV